MAANDRLTGRGDDPPIGKETDRRIAKEDVPRTGKETARRSVAIGRRIAREEIGLRTGKGETGLRIGATGPPTVLEETDRPIEMGRNVLRIAKGDARPMALSGPRSAVRTARRMSRGRRIAMSDRRRRQPIGHTQTIDRESEERSVSITRETHRELCPRRLG